jgi:glycosyltransferase (activator-dependent family)
MRVLFTTYPEKTHFLAMAPLAWALRTAGHEVCFASAPKFSEVITQAGLTAVPIGSNRDLWQLMASDMDWLSVGMNGLPVPYDTAVWPEDQVSLKYLRFGYDLHVPRWHKMSNVPLIPELVSFAQTWRPDLVIWEPSTYAGAIAAEASGAAHARLLFSLDTFGVVRERYLRLNRELPAERQADPLGDWLAPYGRKYGFDFTEDLITGQFTISVMPPCLRVEADLRYVPMRYVPYGGPAAVPRWLRAEPARPRVAITMGISTAEVTGDTINLPEMFEALSDLDVEIIATLSKKAQNYIPRVPGNVKLVSFAPLDALLPTCAAVMHHGGIGTLLTTALHGKPHLIVTWNSDGPSLAQKVAAQGAGLAVNLSQASGGLVRDRLIRLLEEPSYQQDADLLRDEVMAMPSPNHVAGDLEKLVTDHRRAPRPATAGRS